MILAPFLGSWVKLRVCSSVAVAVGCYSRALHFLWESLLNGGHLRMQAMSLEDCFLHSSNDLGCGGCSWTSFTVSQQEFYDTADECEVTVRDNL